MSRLLCNHKKMGMFLMPTFTTNAIAKLDYEMKTGEQQRGLYNAEQCSIAKLKMLCKQGQLKQAIHNLNSMCNPNSSMYASLLQDSIDNKALPVAKLVHAHMILTGFKPGVGLDTKLVVAYTKFLSLKEARQVFDKMRERNVVSWTAMIAAYARSGLAREALLLFFQMQRTDVRPDSFILACVLPVCAVLEVLDYGRELHEYIVRSGFQYDVFVASALVDMYFKCGEAEDARKVFDRTTEQDVVLWNTVLAGYTHSGHVEEALRVFQKIPKPNVVSWNTMIIVYGQNGHVQEAVKLFKNMPERDLFSWHAMVLAYVQNGHVEEAMKVFKEMPLRDVVSWNQMIMGYAQTGRVDEAMKLFEKMPEKDLVSWNTMIAGYMQNGHFEKALDLFRQMPKQCLISWNSMISGYTQNGLFKEALQLFADMLVIGVKPDNVTFASVLPACANMAALEHGRAAHGNIITRGFQSHTFVGNALVDMYAKCGSIGDARNVFDEMPVKDVVSWNAMIVGYATHGLGKEAVQFFENMEHTGMKPNHVTFVGVLSACCHAGLIDDGWKYFNSMSEYDVTPAMEHYCCIVDLLSRAGHLYEAYDFIIDMPIKPNAAVWASLLGACRIHSNMKLGERVAERLFHSDSKSAGHYVLLSNMYAASGRWDDVDKVRRTMKEKSVVKTPGSSWVEVKNKTRAFLVGDRTHLQTREIYAELERLSGQMKETGYVLDTDFALHDVEQEQKEHILGYHSEKLAVVFGLINISSKAPIRVIKNLRVCGDCHSFIKFVSKIATREIILRDAVRFHHFINGQCSCGDYW